MIAVASHRGRVARGGIALILFITLALIALYLRDGWIRPLGGDFLVVIFLYFALRAAMAWTRWVSGAFVFVFAAAVECTQAADLAERLGIDGHPLAIATIGATFDPLDFIAYGLGVILAVLLDRP